MAPPVQPQSTEREAGTTECGCARLHDLGPLSSDGPGLSAASAGGAGAGTSSHTGW